MPRKKDPTPEQINREMAKIRKEREAKPPRGTNEPKEYDKVRHSIHLSR